VKLSPAGRVVYSLLSMLILYSLSRAIVRGEWIYAVLSFGLLLLFALPAVRGRDPLARPPGQLRGMVGWLFEGEPAGEGRRE